MASMIFLADWSETWCSADLPPHRIPTLIFFMALVSFGMCSDQADTLHKLLVGQVT